MNCNSLCKKYFSVALIITFSSLIACGGSSPSNTTDNASASDSNSAGDNAADGNNATGDNATGDNGSGGNVSGDNASAIEQFATVLDGELPSSEQFENSQITEASGLQRSLAAQGVYYVHNDSGDGAVLYVTDAIGQSLGTMTLSNTTATDWEALAGARLNGEAYLVVGDIGNNDRQRNPVQLFVVKEPDFNNLAVGFNIESDSQRIDLSYADGLSYDAEALLIDGDNDSIVIVTKNGQDTTAQGVWKGSLSSGLTDGSIVVEFRGRVSLPAENLVNAITDIDLHPNGREIAVLTYGSLSAGLVHIWEAQQGEGTADALTRAADRKIPVPINVNNTQAEALSYGADGMQLLIAAEGRGVSAVTVISAE